MDFPDFPHFLTSNHLTFYPLKGGDDVEIIRRELVYIVYYFTVQLRQRGGVYAHRSVNEDNEFGRAENRPRT